MCSSHLMWCMSLACEMQLIAGVHIGALSEAGLGLIRCGVYEVQGRQGWCVCVCTCLLSCVCVNEVVTRLVFYCLLVPVTAPLHMHTALLPASAKELWL